MARDVGDDGRLGGPPGLYDSVNSDRGLIQRIRVPEDPRPEPAYPWGITSLNDSDTAEDMPGQADRDEADRMAEGLQSGLALRKSISGSNL